MIGFWALLIFGIMLVSVFAMSMYSACYKKAQKAIVIMIWVAVCFVIIVGGQYWLRNTASGLRMQKSWQSEVSKGIDRVIDVYDINGNLIKSYEGKFDVTHDDKRILFDDEQGKRHVIYFTTGTIVIDEK